MKLTAYSVKLKKVVEIANPKIVTRGLEISMLGIGIS